MKSYHYMWLIRYMKNYLQKGCMWLNLYKLCFSKDHLNLYICKCKMHVRSMMFIQGQRQKKTFFFTSHKILKKDVSELFLNPANSTINLTMSRVL